MRTTKDTRSRGLDYRAMIYAAIVETPWRYADLVQVEAWIRRRHGVIGYMTLDEFRIEAIVGAQSCFERSEQADLAESGASS